jgi:hypothetical protein
VLLDDGPADDLDADRSRSCCAPLLICSPPTRLRAPGSRPSSARLGDRVPASRARSPARVSLIVGAARRVHAPPGLSYGRKWTPRMHEVCGTSLASLPVWAYWSLASASVLRRVSKVRGSPTAESLTVVRWLGSRDRRPTVSGIVANPARGAGLGVPGHGALARRRHRHGGGQQRHPLLRRRPDATPAVAPAIGRSTRAAFGFPGRYRHVCRYLAPAARGAIDVSVRRRSKDKQGRCARAVFRPTD